MGVGEIAWGERLRMGRDEDTGPNLKEDLEREDEPSCH